MRPEIVIIAKQSAETSYHPCCLKIIRIDNSRPHECLQVARPFKFLIMEVVICHRTEFKLLFQFFPGSLGGGGSEYGTLSSGSGGPSWFFCCFLCFVIRHLFCRFLCFGFCFRRTLCHSCFRLVCFHLYFLFPKARARLLSSIVLQTQVLEKKILQQNWFSTSRCVGLLVLVKMLVVSFRDSLQLSRTLWTSEFKRLMS